MASGQSKNLGRGLVYGTTLVPLLATLGFYFLQYVPSRQEYFLNLRFRTLGVIGKQIEAKLEAVSSGLTYGTSVRRIDQRPADGPPQRISLDEYVSRIFPGWRSQKLQHFHPKRHREIRQDRWLAPDCGVDPRFIQGLVIAETGSGRR
jgi:hypothetical protein